MARSKRKRDKVPEAYRKIRKAVPPPTRVAPDRRRRFREEQARRESRIMEREDERL